MKTILVIGNSLTAGIPGARYTTRLAEALPEYHFIFDGLGGDILAGVAQRTARRLENLTPDLLVLEIGANDILLPYLSERGGLWKIWADWKIRSGSQPCLTPASFGALYIQTIQQVRQHGIPQVLVTTISCLGERLDNPQNRLRQAYNAQIEEVASQEGLLCAPLGEAFDRLLSSLSHPSGYLLARYSLMLFDALVTRVEACADWVSRQRGLRLTTDGVHLNRQGASLMTQTIAGQIRSALTNPADDITENKKPDQ